MLTGCYMNKLLMPIAAACILAGCSVPVSYYQSEVLNIKRNPDVGNIDIGNKIPESALTISAGYQHPVTRPELRVFNDTVIITKDFQTMTTYINTTGYEARNAIFCEIGYGIKDELGAGVTADFSFGDAGAPAADQEVMNKTTVDIGFYLRAMGSIGDFCLGVRPDLLISSINGRKTLVDSVNGDYTGNLHYVYLTERITLFFRYAIYGPVSILAGAQQRRVVFSEEENTMLLENAFSAYTGFSMKLGLAEIAPYLGIPISTDYTRTSSPIQIGIKTVLLVPKLHLP
jgi:hypothetical protein